MGASAGRKLELSSGAAARTSILPPLPRLARAGRGGGLELAEAMARAAPSSSLLPPSPSPPLLANGGCDGGGGRQSR